MHLPRSTSHRSRPSVFGAGRRIGLEAETSPKPLRGKVAMDTFLREPIHFPPCGFSITTSPRSSVSPALTVKSLSAGDAIRPLVEKW